MYGDEIKPRACLVAERVGAAIAVGKKRPYWIIATLNLIVRVRGGATELQPRVGGVQPCLTRIKVIEHTLEGTEGWGKCAIGTESAENK